MACSQQVSSWGPVDRLLSSSRWSWNHTARASSSPCWVMASRSLCTGLELRPSSSCRRELKSRRRTQRQGRDPARPPAWTHPHVVEVDGEGCEGVSQGSVAPRQPAQPLGGVRLHGVVRLGAAAHRAAQLSGCGHGQAAHLRHAQPGRDNPSHQSGVRLTLGSRSIGVRWDM